MDMDLVACGGYSVESIGVDFLVLGAIGLLLARRWPASRWLSAASIAWYLLSSLADSRSERWLALVNYVSQSGSEIFTIGCALLALLLPFLPSPRTQWRFGRVRPRRIARARGLIVFVHVEPGADSV
jgi:hypothetical protein